MPQFRSPECPNGDDASKCRVSVTVSLVEPLIEWEPEYDGLGQMINSDPNSSLREYECATCGLKWSEVFTHTPPPAPEQGPM